MEGIIVEIEVDTGGDMGLPGVVIVGLPDASVQESRERELSAIKNAGLHYPRKRITLFLAPASVRKEGPTYDLPTSLGVLIAADALDGDCLKDTVVLGELPLDRSIRHVRGMQPIIAVTRCEGNPRVIVPFVDTPQAALLPEMEVIPVNNLKELFLHLKGIQNSSNHSR